MTLLQTNFQADFLDDGDSSVPAEGDLPIETYRRVVFVATMVWLL